MLFYEPLFLFYVLPIFFVIFLASCNHFNVRKVILIGGSILIYAWGEPLFVPVVVLSMIVDQLVGTRLSPVTPHPWRQLLLAAAVAQNLAILTFYKYADFLLENVNAVAARLGADPIPLLHIALPIGVSFIVFEKLSYVVDVYRGTTPPAERLSDYCVFVFLFPKLLAGPILKYHEVREQILLPRTIPGGDVRDGFERFARGMIKKLLLADPLGSYADFVFDMPWSSLGFVTAWLGLLSFTLQVYFDFSGYSDMALGLGRMMGFRFSENFRFPYISRSLTEFWQRWHISFTTWVRDYLYFPLGGSRASTVRTYFNLWLCFLLSGLWHGARWNLVLWGAYNGVILVIERLVMLRQLERLQPAVANAITMFLFMLGLAIFRTNSLAHIPVFFQALLTPSLRGEITHVSTDTAILLGIGLFISIFPRLPFYDRLAVQYQNDGAMRSLARLGIALLFVIACGRTVAAPFKPFLYFRF